MLGEPCARAVSQNKQIRGIGGFIVNHTPLWAVSMDLNDPEPLWPAMLLQHQHAVGTGLLTGVQPTTEALQHYRPSSYSVNRELASNFWSVWQMDYVAQLSVRCK